MAKWQTVVGGVLIAGMWAMVPARCQAAVDSIAPTAATMDRGDVEVTGQPRMSKGHPCTLWDQEDIARLQKQLATCQPLQEEFAKLKKEMDRRIAQPLGVPEPGSGPFPRDVLRAHAANAHTISDLGTIYALTGEAKYGEFCKKMLVAYAAGYPTYKHPADWTERRYRSAQDGRLTGQFLEDGGWLIQVARGYDLVYNLPTWTTKERRQVRDDLFEAITYEFVADIVGTPSYLDQTHNRSVICNCGVLLAGYASDDEKLIQYGLYGKNGTRQKPTGGVFGAHLGPQCIDVDGMWNEGAMGYQFMALGALIDDAETLWHHGMDLYRYHNGVLKGLFDSPLEFAYPDLTVPATHDSARTSLLLYWFTDCHHTYEYGYLRYRDPRYLTIINQTKPHLQLSIHQGPTSVLFDRSAEKPAALPCQSVNFAGVGYGILRVPSAHGTASLLLEYGPSRSHGHPSKLAVDLYALDDQLLPDPGVIFPYDNPLDVKWYWTSPGHNVLTVDEKPQIYGGNRYKFPRNLPDPDAHQLVYGPAATMGIQRAASTTVYPGVAQDRAVFFTPQYLADLYGAGSSTSHKYDLGWHIRGELTTDLPLATLKFAEPVENGYNALSDVRHATCSKGWSATVTRGGNAVRLLAAAGDATEVIVGSGFCRAARGDEPTPAIYERRTASSTLYGNAVDFSAAKGGYVKSVVQEGGADAGYGLLQVETSQGTDLCFASYRSGTHKTSALETDALQALVLMDGENVRALYLGGGTKLRVAGGAIWRKTPGLASVERLPGGGYLVSNPSASDGAIAVQLPALAAGMKAYPIDTQGNRGRADAAVKGSASGVFTLQLKPGAKVEFTSRTSTR
jgi:hypothetical protein